MLYNIDPILSPDLLYTLRAMGHGDEIVIADANFPGESLGPDCIRADGSTASEMLTAILSLMPLDRYADEQALTMQVVGSSDEAPEAVADFRRIVLHKCGSGVEVRALERFAFYERAARAFAIVQTGERRLYGNIIVKKGVIDPSADR